MNLKWLCMFILFTFILTKRLTDNEIKASIQYNFDSKTYNVIMDAYDVTMPAYATYKKEMENSGWDALAVSSYLGEDSKYTDEVKAYAMGYLEGYLTSDRIWNHYLNSNAYFFNKSDGKMPENTKTYLTENRNWIYQMYAEKGSSDSYWTTAYLLYRQFEGLIDGYNSLAKDDKKLTAVEGMVMNSRDVADINYWKAPDKRPQYHLMSVNEISEYIDFHNHCSALIKVAPDFSDVWFGHNTWDSFSTMTRIFKEYRYQSNSKMEKALTVALSSYPGTINSIDDFYLTDQDLYVTETTNEIFATKLYDLLDPNSLMTWHRASIANRLANNGQSWTQIFSENNSGTYNNQFQILDLKQIDLNNKIISDNALWIIEQIPGYTESDDVTKLLKYGYWGSYNSAFFKNIRSKSGYDSMLFDHPEMKDIIDYYTCARANIFRRDQGNVVDLNSFKHIMRYNDYLNDPLSKKNPAFAIACRKDLDETKPDCRGAIDAKIASAKNIKGKDKKVISLISGPTTDNQVSFNTANAKCISSSPGKYLFNGLPQNFSFNWIDYETSLFTQ